MYEDNTIYFF